MFVFRLKEELPTNEYTRIIFALSELMHSPDEEVMQDVCLSLHTVCLGHPQCLPVLMEFGVLSRMKECLREHQLPALAAAGAAAAPLRKGKMGNADARHGASSGSVAMSEGDAGVGVASQDSSEGIVVTDSSMSVYEVAMLVLCAVLRMQESRVSSLTASLRTAKCMILLPCSSQRSALKTARSNSTGAAASVVQHMASYLNFSQCSDSTGTEIFKGLLGAMLPVSDSAVSRRATAAVVLESLAYGIINSCAAAIFNGSSDAANAAGHCLCRSLEIVADVGLRDVFDDTGHPLSKQSALLHCSSIPPLQVHIRFFILMILSIYFLPSLMRLLYVSACVCVVVTVQVLQALTSLCGASDTSLQAGAMYIARLLVFDLFAVISWHLKYQHTLPQHLHPEAYHSTIGELTAKVDSLLSHPMQEIAFLASELETFLDKFIEVYQ